MCVSANCSGCWVQNNQMKMTVYASELKLLSHTNTHSLTHARTHTHTHTHTHREITDIEENERERKLTCTHIHTCMCAHTCMHTSTHAHTHTHTQITDAEENKREGKMNTPNNEM